MRKTSKLISFAAAAALLLSGCNTDKHADIETTTKETTAAPEITAAAPDTFVTEINTSVPAAESTSSERTLPDVFKDDTEVNDIELKEYKPDYEIYDYASARGLSFPLQEQADVYNAAYAFAEHSPINEENQDREGFFTVSGVRTYGRLTGYTFDSYDTYRRTIFTPVGIYNVRAYEYGKNGELFWNMGERGVPGYETQYKIIYSDDEQVIVRLDAKLDEMFANVKNTREVNYTILLLTEDGWRVDLLRDPQLF